MNTASGDREHLQFAEQIARQSNCVSRRVGCVIVRVTPCLPPDGTVCTRHRNLTVLPLDVLAAEALRL